MIDIFAEHIKASECNYLCRCFRTTKNHPSFVINAFFNVHKRLITSDVSMDHGVRVDWFLNKMCEILYCVAIKFHALHIVKDFLITKPLKSQDIISSYFFKVTDIQCHTYYEINLMHAFYQKILFLCDFRCVHCAFDKINVLQF